MKRFFIFTLAILSLFSLFLTPSDAIEITALYSTYDDSDARGCLYITAYAETDSPFLYLYWYIDGVHQSSSAAGTSATFSPNSAAFPGSREGTTYTIKAVAYQYDPETNLMLSDSESYSVTVYTPCLETAAILMASVSSCSWNGPTASASSSASVEHTGEDNAPAVDYIINFGFKVSRLQANGNVAEDVYNPQPDRSQGTVNAGDARVTRNFSDSYTLVNGWRPNQTFEVYTRATAWAVNNDRNAVAEECVDESSSTYTIPRN